MALFINASVSPTVSNVRLCWQVGGTVAPIVPFPGGGAMPGSDYPGIPLGGAASMGDVRGLSSGEIRFYAIDAENLARLEQGQTQTTTCDHLICGQGSGLPSSCLRYDLDYWPAAALPALDASDPQSVLALTGCLATALDPTASLTRCGSSWDAVEGNLRVELAHLQPAPPLDAGQLSFQVALLSPALAEALGDGGALVSFGTEDGGTPVATLGFEDDVEPAGSVGTVSLGTSLAVFGSRGFGVDAPGLANGAGREWMSLVQAQQLVDPTQDPAVFFGQPRTYLVAVVGDPGSPHAFTSTDAGYDGTGLHVLVIATPQPEAPDAGAPEDAGAEAAGE